MSMMIKDVKSRTSLKGNHLLLLAQLQWQWIEKIEMISNIRDKGQISLFGHETKVQKRASFFIRYIPVMVSAISVKNPAWR